MRQLLVEYIPFDVNPSLIQESINHNTPLIVSGILQRAGVKNQNGRIYPKPILTREISRYLTEVQERRALGELDHPDSTVVNLGNTSHLIRDIHWENDDVVGQIEILSTPSGNILKELFRAGIKLGISSRGLGSVRKIDETTVEVDEDFSLVCFDFVSNPSTQGGWMSPVQKLHENTIFEKNVGKYYKLNKLITEILIGV